MNIKQTSDLTDRELQERIALCNLSIVNKLQFFYNVTIAGLILAGIAGLLFITSLIINQ